MIIDHCDKTISIKIVYFGPALSGKTTSIKALFSDFGKEEDVYSIENNMSIINNITFDPVNTRYVRMYGTQRITNWGYSIIEFQVHSADDE